MRHDLGNTYLQYSHFCDASCWAHADYFCTRYIIVLNERTRKNIYYTDVLLILLCTTAVRRVHLNNFHK